MTESKSIASKKKTTGVFFSSASMYFVCAAEVKEAQYIGTSLSKQETGRIKHPISLYTHILVHFTTHFLTELNI